MYKNSIIYSCTSVIVSVIVTGCSGGGGSATPAPTPTPSPPPIVVNQAPSFTSATSHTVQANLMLTGYQAIAEDAENDTLTYAIAGGDDEMMFNIDRPTGRLSFKSRPDYSAPSDANADNIFEVSISASDGENTTSQTLFLSLTEPTTDFLADSSHVIFRNRLIDRLNFIGDITGDGIPDFYHRSPSDNFLGKIHPITNLQFLSENPSLEELASLSNAISIFMDPNDNDIDISFNILDATFTHIFLDFEKLTDDASPYTAIFGTYSYGKGANGDWGDFASVVKQSELKPGANVQIAKASEDQYFLHGSLNNNGVREIYFDFQNFIGGPEKDLKVTLQCEVLETNLYGVIEFSEFAQMSADGIQFDGSCFPDAEFKEDYFNFDEDDLLEPIQENSLDLNNDGYGDAKYDLHIFDEYPDNGRHPVNYFAFGNEQSDASPIDVTHSNGGVRFTTGAVHELELDVNSTFYYEPVNIGISNDGSMDLLFATGDKCRPTLLLYPFEELVRLGNVKSSEIEQSNIAMRIPLPDRMIDDLPHNPTCAFGYSSPQVKSLNDLNGDGYDDIMVTILNYDSQNNITYRSEIVISGARIAEAYHLNNGIMDLNILD